MMTSLFRLCRKENFFTSFDTVAVFDNKVECCFDVVASVDGTLDSPLRETYMIWDYTVLPGNRAEVRLPPLPPAEAGTRFSDPEGMQL